MKKIFSISKDNHSGLVRKLTIVHEYMHFTDNSFFDNHTSFDSSGYKGEFNNYVHCNPVQGQYRARTGFSLCTFPTQGKTCLH